MKICNKCHIEKSEDNFWRDKWQKDGRATFCKQCKSIYQRRYYARNKEEMLSYSRQYSRNLALKNGKLCQGKFCEICGSPPHLWNQTKHKRLAKDHNHITNKHRGYLCMACNRGLGCFKDNVNLLYKSIDYMNKYDGLNKEKGVAI